MVHLFTMLLMLVALPLSAQDVWIEEDVQPTLNYYQDIIDKILSPGNSIGNTSYIDSIPDYLKGKTVSGNVLKDRHGKTCNMGVFDKPYVFHSDNDQGSHRTNPPIYDGPSMLKHWLIIGGNPAVRLSLRRF